MRWAGETSSALVIAVVAPGTVSLPLLDHYRAVYTVGGAMVCQCAATGETLVHGQIRIISNFVAPVRETLEEAERDATLEVLGMTR